MTLLALSVAFPLVAIFLARFPFVGSILPHATAALVPFLFVGLFAALTFARAPSHSGLLYGADLLGAGVGVAAAVGLLDLLGAFNVVMGLGIVAALASIVISLLSARRSHRVSSLVCLLFGAALLALNLLSTPFAFVPVRLIGAPRDKTMVSVLRDPSQSARVVYTAWGPFARVDVVETADPGLKGVFTDGGAGSEMIRFDGDLEAVASLRETPEFLPFVVGPVERTLILGAGAGKDVLLALLADAQRITAVEVNPAMVEATCRFADYNGHILDQPGVELVVGDARTFVERSSEQYDLIYLNLVYTQAAEPASQALVENYVFTRQAFRAYLDHLAPGGRLAIVSHNALEGSRAAITGVQVLADEGEPLPTALRHMALLMLPVDDPTRRTSVMVLGKEPLREGQLQRLAKGARQLGMQPLYLSGVFEAPFAPLLEGAAMETYLAGNPVYDLRPTSDDRPFFFKLDRGLPEPIVYTLVFAMVLGAALLAVTLWQARRGRRGTGRGKWAAIAVYGAITGAAFMLLEVPLIQRFQLLLGYPVLSLTVVLGTLLLAGGLGSLISQSWPRESLPRRVAGAAMLIGALALLYRPVLPALVRQLLPAPLVWRVLVTVGLTALLGLPLGVPFPSALRLAGERQRRRVPLIWGVNGAFSVLGSTLAVLVAMTWGFDWAMTAGAALYAVLAVVARRLRSA
jgi:SAM-dependent methyltransferase